VKIHINAPIERVFAAVDGRGMDLAFREAHSVAGEQSGGAGLLQRGGLRFTTMLAAVSFDLQRRVMDMEAAF
jgi:hypothetical protein